MLLIVTVIIALHAFAQLSVIDSLTLILITVYDIIAKARINMPTQPIKPLISPANLACFALFSYVDNRCVRDVQRHTQSCFARK